MYLVTKAVGTISVFIFGKLSILNKPQAKTCTLVLDDASRKGGNMVYNLDLSLIFWS